MGRREVVVTADRENVSRVVNRHGLRVKNSLRSKYYVLMSNMHAENQMDLLPNPYILPDNGGGRHDIPMPV